MVNHNTFSDELFRAFFDIPVVHYSDEIVSNLPANERMKWDQFLLAKQELEEAGIIVVIVPLSMDKRQNIWWTDYATSYVDRFNLNPDDAPELDVILKINDNQKLIQRHEIWIDHMGITRKTKKILLSILNKYEWFKWNGKQNKRMQILLY